MTASYPRAAGPGATPEGRSPLNGAARTFRREADRLAAFEGQGP
jgi:hypothetical protein